LKPIDAVILDMDGLMLQVERVCALLISD